MPPGKLHAAREVIRALGHGILVLLLTLLTQLGGIAWLIALAFRRRTIAFGAVYLLLSLVAIWVAPMFGRVPLPCWGDGALRAQSWVFCAMNRQYVVPEVKEMLTDLAETMEDRFPGVRVQVLDANFPFVTGFPLMPHLSHDDGEKVDIAFFYADRSGRYLPGVTRSPVGYFAFEEGDTECPPAWPTLRWDLAWLQPLWPDLMLDRPRNRAALDLLEADPRAGKIFVEPHLRAALGALGPKVRFQGCRAARHDDHIHIQL